VGSPTRAAVRLTRNGADDAGHGDGRAKKRHGQNSDDDEQYAQRPTSLSPRWERPPRVGSKWAPFASNSKREATDAKPAA